MIQIHNLAFLILYGVAHQYYVEHKLRHAIKWMNGWNGLKPLKHVMQIIV